MNQVDRIVEDLFRQLNVSDSYEKQARKKDEIMPTVWELMNGHMRDLLNELSDALKAAK